MSRALEPWRVENDVLRVFVRLTPRGGRDAIDGVAVRDDGRAVLKVRVRAAPESGEANSALVRLLAKSLGVSSSQVTLVAGHTARIKTLSVAADAAGLVKAMAALALFCAD